MIISVVFVMRCLFLIPIISILIDAYSKRCPDGYDLVFGGRCIRVLNERVKDTPDKLLAGALTECAKDGAFPPIVRSDEDNDGFNKIASGFPAPAGQMPNYLILGLVCSAKSHQLHWADGSAVDYTKNDVSVNLDCTKEEMVVSRPANDDWYNVTADRKDYYYTVMCATDPIEDADSPCGNYDDMSTVVTGESPCIKVYKTELSWDESNAQCEDEGGTLATILSKEENDYIWRTAVGAEAVYGMHIGMRQSPDEVWQWIGDGSNITTDDGYSNFIPGFPLDTSKSASCGAMQTDMKTAFWMDIQCDEELPFVCRRNKMAASPGDCPAAQPTEGDEIVPPGFPNSNVSCDYMLRVDAGKQVELTIEFVEANICCDYLEIFEGEVGMNLLGYLSGEVVEPTVITTTTSNVMRVNWSAGGAVNVRGFRMRFKGV